jgi:hypothetical protein
MITVDTSALNRSLSRFAAATRRDASDVAHQAMRGILKTVIMITPPGTGPNDTATAAKKRGEAKVESDIRKMFKPERVWAGPARRSTAGGRIQIKAKHQAGRSPRTGRVLGGKRRKVIPVPEADLTAYIRDRKKKVGILMSGWKPAAERMGVSMPAWARRHSGPGHITIKQGQNGISLIAENSVSYGRTIRDIDRRLAWAVAFQRNKTERQLAALLKKRTGGTAF